MVEREIVYFDVENSIFSMLAKSPKANILRMIKISVCIHDDWCNRVRTETFEVFGTIPQIVSSAIPVQADRRITAKSTGLRF